MEDRMWEYSDNNTFRMGPIEVVKDASGNEIGVRECQELIEGRWESFLSLEPAPTPPCLVKRGRQRAK